MQRILSRACMTGILILAASANASAALTMFLDPGDLNPGVSGPGTFDVDVFINWDGTGENRLAGITFGLTMPAELSVADEDFNAGTNAERNPFDFTLGRVRSNSFFFSNLPGVPEVALANGDNRLTTIAFNATATSGDFPIGVELREATGPLFADIRDQFSVSGGTLSLAVPEPSSFAAISLFALGLSLRRRRS